MSLTRKAPTISTDQKISLSLPEVTVTEGTGNNTNQVVFDISLSRPATQSMQFNYITVDGSAQGGLDYIAKAGVMIIEEGSTSSSFSIEIIRDGLAEASEIFSIKLIPLNDGNNINGNLRATFTIVDDDAAPTVVGVTSPIANGDYTVGTSIPISVQFSGAVIVTGTPRLALNTSPLAHEATYVSGSGTDTLVFNYVISAPDTSADLDYTSISALSLSGGSIGDSFGNDAILTLPFAGLPGSLGFSKNIVIDTTSPAVPDLQLLDPVTLSSTHVAQPTVNSTIVNDTDAHQYWWKEQASSSLAPTAPTAGDPGWQNKPTTIVLSGAGSRTVYLYTKDTAGNISAAAAMDSIYYSIPDHLEVMSGDAQSAVVGSTLGTALQIKVVDASGILSPGVSLSFTPSAGSVSNTTVVTDSAGAASVNYSLSTTAGLHSIHVGRTTTVLPDAAGSGRADFTFSETATPDVPDHLNIFAGNNQTQTIGLALSTKPNVMVVDKYENGISGFDMNFTLSQGNGWIDFGKSNPGLVTTDSSGNATVDFVAGFNSLTSVIAAKPLSVVLPDVNLTGRTSVKFTVTASTSNALFPFQSLRGDSVTVGNAVGIESFDANNDGLLDLVNTNSGANNLSLYLNSVSGFLPKTNITTVSGIHRYVISSGDFNSDGKIDIIYGSNYGGVVYIQLGDGNGGFSTEVGRSLPSNGYITSIVTADLNGDGKLDAAVSDTYYNKVHVFWGNGAGATTGYTSFVVGTDPRRLIVLDWNKDTKPDIAVSNYDSNNITILIGDGTGAFPTSQVHSVGTSPYGVRSADLNGDTNPDILVTHNGAFSATILFGDGAGGVLLSSTLALSGNGRDTVIADFNNDGKFDIAALVTSNHGFSHYQILGGDGSGVFTEIGRVGAGIFSQYTDKIAVGDYNGDGNLDLANAGISSGNGSNLHIVPIVYGDGTGHFTTNPTVTVGTNPSRVAIDDFNKDGNLDVAVTNKGANTLSILLGNGLGQLALSQTLSVGTQPTAVISGDFNRDGKQDLIVGNSGSANVSIVLGKGDGTFNIPVTNMAVTTGPADICQADFNKDGKPDIAVASSGGGGTLKTYYGDGNGGFAVSSTISLSGTPYQLICTDLNKDTEIDIVSSVGQNIAVALNNGSGGFAAAPTSVLIGSGVVKHSIAVGDFNSDGNLDLLGTRFYNTAIDRYYGDGTGSFSSSSAIGSSFDVTHLVTGDFNGDGKIDVLEHISNASQITVQYGDGISSFTTGQANWLTGNVSGRPVLGDLNGDGKLDIVVPNSNDNNISLLLSQ